MQKHALVAALCCAAVACHREVHTTPVDDALSPLVRAQLAIGREDAVLGDPDPELARVRRLAALERENPALTVLGATRLFRLHAMRLALAASEEEHAEVLARFREDEALLLHFVPRSDVYSVFDLAELDPDLPTREPAGTRAALFASTRRGLRYARHLGRVNARVERFLDTLPDDLFAFVYAHDISSDDARMERTSNDALGAYAYRALEVLLRRATLLGDDDKIKQILARLLTIDPGAVEHQLSLLMVVRDEPRITRSLGEYLRAVSDLGTSRDGGRHPGLLLSIAHGLGENEQASAAVLLAPLLVHADEDVRRVARAVACDRVEDDASCEGVPRPREDLARTDEEYVPREHDEPSYGCWDDVARTPGPSMWTEFFACAGSGAVPPEPMFGVLARAPLPIAPRATRWLDEVARNGSPISTGYAALRLEIALGGGDVAHARTVYAAFAPLLPPETKVAYQLALADAEAARERGEERLGLVLGDEVGNVGSRTERNELAAVFDAVFSLLDRQGCPPTPPDEETEPTPAEESLLERYRGTFGYDALGHGRQIARTLEVLAGSVDQESAGYLLGLAALHALYVGDVDMASSFAQRVHGLVRGSVVDQVVRIAIARAREDLPAVRTGAAALVRVAPEYAEVVGHHLTRREDEESASYAGAYPARQRPEGDARCARRDPSEAMLASLATSEGDRAFARDMLEAFEQGDDERSQLRFDRELRRASRDPAVNAMRCLLGVAIRSYDDEERMTVLPAAMSRAEPETASGDRARRVAQACEAALRGGARSEERLEDVLEAWGAALSDGAEPTPAMLESYLAATARSQTPLVQRYRMRALIRLERFSEARDEWAKGLDVRCSGTDSHLTVAGDETRLIAPELGLLMFLGSADEQFLPNAFYMQRWRELPRGVELEPLVVLVARDLEARALDRLSGIALLEGELEGMRSADDVRRRLLARNPRSLFLRAGVLRASSPRSRRPQPCGTRTECDALAATLLAEAGTDRYVALTVADYKLAGGDRAGARTVLEAALAVHPDATELRRLLVDHCGVPIADAATTCEAVAECCEAYIEAMGGGGAGLDAEQICMGVRQAGAAGPPGESACAAAREGWVQSLTSMNREIPPECASP